MRQLALVSYGRARVNGGSDLSRMYARCVRRLLPSSASARVRYSGLSRRPTQRPKRNRPMVDGRTTGYRMGTCSVGRSVGRGVGERLEGGRKGERRPGRCGSQGKQASRWYSLYWRWRRRSCRWWWQQRRRRRTIAIVSSETSTTVPPYRSI